MGLLKFLGRGSAFNSKEGNTSAFIKKDNYLLLIDCGEDIFDRIIKAKLLDGVNIVDVLITHLHPDHAGSLGTFIFYCYYIKNLRINVYYEDMNTLEDFLSLQEVDKSKYNLIDSLPFVYIMLKCNLQIIRNIDTKMSYLVVNIYT